MVSSDRGRHTTAQHPDSTPDNDHSKRRRVEPQRARQGEIMLKTSAQRWIFFGALGLAAVFGVAIAILA